ncbi:MAG: glycoside hydrolase family 2 TIM barrel-domain containing protein [Prevotella sp.]|nr:glycoside hydrolase family 2 TIM barrel-domain containing protein [Prevotella sp.]
MKQKRKFLLGMMLAVCGLSASADDRRLFDEGWQFTQTDSVKMSWFGYNDKTWRTLDLPHDWAIEGDFMATAPSGASGGALPGGIGWYRKHFNVNKADKGKKLFIDFDGVYMNAKVWINGHELGQRPYGYSSFRYDLTPHLNYGGDNVVAVRVDNSDQPNSRWYSGCGIYRHVYLVSTDNVHVSHWGTWINAEVQASGAAVFKLDVELDNETGKSKKVTVVNTLLDASGKAVGSSSSAVKLPAGASRKAVSQSMTLKSPQLWSMERPYIYKVRTQVKVGGKVVDEYYTNTGVRSFRFDAEKGFFLNGKNMKINGVCQHHDMGCLGAAVNEDALYRQLKMLRDMGANAIRCSHNPPAPELLNMCDTMGLIVMDESFDMWHRRKTKNDYARFFDKWAERDLTDLVRRDRNHPSILMWSIGNEVLEQWSSADADNLTAEQANLILNAGHDASTLAKDGEELSPNSILTRNLCNIIRRLDNTRPITAGCNEPDPGNHLFKSGALDIIGFNYHHEWVKDVPKNFPGKPFIFSESVSALQTRDYYMMPSDSVRKAPQEWWMPYTDPSFQCSAYDNMHASWSSTHEQTWDVVKHNDFVGGQFIWTGWDYIGEPTPYGFPARSSYFGIIDLAGMPKDVYYMYQGEWTDRQVCHLFPHWNWLDGQQIDLWCYYNNADEVELFINGKSQGVRTKGAHDYHVMWRVTYEKGEAKVVARKNGKVVATDVRRTAGAPHHIRLTADKTSLAANGKSLSFVNVDIVDADGNVCPWAENLVFFELSGAARLDGVDNGNPASMERFKDNRRKAFFGRCLAVVRSAKQAGKAVLKARAYGLPDAEIEIEVK